MGIFNKKKVEKEDKRPKCKACQGLGFDAVKERSCEVCDGSGKKGKK